MVVRSMAIQYSPGLFCAGAKNARSTSSRVTSYKYTQ